MNYFKTSFTAKIQYSWRKAKNEEYNECGRLFFWSKQKLAHEIYKYDLKQAQSELGTLVNGEVWHLPITLVDEPLALGHTLVERLRDAWWPCVAWLRRRLAPGLDRSAGALGVLALVFLCHRHGKHSTKDMTRVSLSKQKELHSQFLWQDLVKLRLVLCSVVKQGSFYRKNINQNCHDGKFV